MLKAKFSFLIVIMFSSIASVTAGGWFYSDDEADTRPEAVQIVVTMNDDGTITTSYKFTFNGQLTDFAWIVPLPSAPIAVEETAFDWDWGYYTPRDGLYQPTFPRNNNPCDTLLFGYVHYAFGSGGLNWGEFAPINYNIFTIDELIAWMGSHQYAYTTSELDILNQYAHEGMVFLAMPMEDIIQNDDSIPNIGDTTPISITYQADELRLPFMLISETMHNIPTYLWIYGDTRYVPVNYALAPVDFTQLTTFQQSMHPIGLGQTPSPYQVYQNNYASLRRDRVLAFDAEAFIIEYANIVADDEPLSEYEYVTRLYGITGNSAADPIFRAAPNMRDVSNVIDIQDYQDPLHFYGCSNRPSYEQTLSDDTYDWTALPSDRARAYGFEIAIPENWVMTESDRVTLFAERTISEEEIDYLAEAYNNTLDIPVFAFSPYYMGQVEGTGSAPRFSGYLHSSSRFIPFSYETNVQAIIRTTDEDWEANAAMYQVMLKYFHLMPNYLGDGLDYTLFLNDGISIGYPDTWVEATSDNGEPTIYPVNGDEALIRVRDNSWYEASDDDEWQTNRVYQLELIQNAYPDSDFSTLMELAADNNLPCIDPYLALVETENRIGYMVVISMNDTYPTLIEFTTTHELWDQYQDILLYIAEHIDDVPCMLG